MYIKKGDDLKRGKAHPKNRQAQKELNALGYDLGNTGAKKDGVDGDFGPKTEAAVKKFQKDTGLPVTGVINPETGAMLNDRYCTWLEGELEKERKKNKQADGEKKEDPDADHEDADEKDDDKKDDEKKGDEKKDDDKKDEEKKSEQQQQKPDSDSGLTDEDRKKLRKNAETWKANARLCKTNTDACKAAIDWVKNNGKFAPAGSGKGFEKAMGISGGRSLASAFRLAKLLGILAQESSFGTNLGGGGLYRGPFQLSSDVVADFNRHNPGQNITWPDDIDGANDISTAAKVAAWYLAYILQQLTFNADGLTEVTDPEEANKLALAAYNGGIGTVNGARKRAKAAGKDPNKWSDVKDFLPDGTDAEKAKKKEIIDYVHKVREYERLAKLLKCV